MIWLINMLIWGHVHRWTILSSKKMNKDGDPDDVTRLTRYTLQCTVCGDIETRDS